MTQEQFELLLKEQKRTNELLEEFLKQLQACRDLVIQGSVRV
jgi:hypothetical protein